jgi:hypothetical protein
MSDEDQLTPADCEFETALRSLRPVPVSIDQTVIGTRHRPHFSHVRFWPVAAAIAVVAGAAWMAISLREQKPVVVEHSLPRAQAAIPHDTDSPMAPATLLAYRQALAKSPAEFEALLDHQSSMGTMLQNTEAQLTMSTLRTIHLQPSQGNM